MRCHASELKGSRCIDDTLVTTQSVGLKPVHPDNTENGWRPEDTGDFEGREVPGEGPFVLATPYSRLPCTGETPSSVV